MRKYEFTATDFENGEEYVRIQILNFNNHIAKVERNVKIS